MKTMNKHFGQKALALAIATAFGSAAYAEGAADVAELTQPSSSISVGVAGVSGSDNNRAFFGQYNGMRNDDAYGLVDIDIVRRDEALGEWIKLQGTNLGLDNRELSASYEKQGSWKVNGFYNELTHRELRTINTADTGVGSSTPTVVRLATPGTGDDKDFKLKRQAFGFGGEMWLTPSVLFEVNFKNEDKNGERFTGKGYDCVGYVCAPPTTVTGAALTAYPLSNVKNALLMQAEPVDFNTKQVDMRLSFNDEKLNVNAGYYGSWFNNAEGSVNMTVPNALNNGLGTAANPLYPATAATVIAGGGTSLQNVLQLPFALSPDNQAHQFYVDGNYNFTKSTKATFKYSYTHATQDQSFSSMGLPGAPGNLSNLNGEVNSTLAQLGFTTKPLPKLTLSANVRYEDKEDKTPKYLYNVEAVTRNPVVAGLPTSVNENQTGVTPALWYNGLTSGSKLAGKLEASYQFPQNFRGTFGMDYTKLEREVPRTVGEDYLAGISTVRAKNEESGFRLELAHAMSESFSGTVGYYNSKRRGDDWTSLSLLNPAVPGGLTAANAALVNRYCGGAACYGQQVPDSTIAAMSATAIFPMSMTDLNREKWKLTANWLPLESLSLQFHVEDGHDDNVTSYDHVAGQKGQTGTDNLIYSFDAAYSISDNWQLTGYASHGKQSMGINHSTGYLLDLENTSDAFGLGLKGQINARFKMGASFSYINDVTKYGVNAAGSAVGAAPSAANLAQAAIGMPNVKFNQQVFNVYGNYTLDKHSGVRVDLTQYHGKLDEWAWGTSSGPFVYADNTTVKLNDTQNVTFLAARYIYSFK